MLTNIKLRTVNIRWNYAGIACIVVILFCRLNALYAQDAIQPPPSGYDSYHADIPHCTTVEVVYYSSVAEASKYTRILLPRIRHIMSSTCYMELGAILTNGIITGPL